MDIDPPVADTEALRAAIVADTHETTPDLPLNQDETAGPSIGVGQATTGDMAGTSETRDHATEDVTMDEATAPVEQQTVLQSTVTTTSASITTHLSNGDSYSHPPPQTVNTADVFSSARAQIPTPPTPSSSLPMANAEAGPSSAPITVPSAASPFNGINATSSLQPVNQSTMYRTGYIYDPLMMLHCPEGYVPSESTATKGEIHPEEPMRIKLIYDTMSAVGFIKRMYRIPYAEATLEQIMLVHTKELWDKVQGTQCRLIS